MIMMIMMIMIVITSENRLTNNLLIFALLNHFEMSHIFVIGTENDVWNGAQLLNELCN